MHMTPNQLIVLILNHREKEDGKGRRRMPWHRKPMKDAASCDNPR